MQHHSQCNSWGRNWSTGGATAVFGTNPLAMPRRTCDQPECHDHRIDSAGNLYVRISESIVAQDVGPGPGSSVQLLTLIVNAAVVDTTTAVTDATATYGDASVTLDATVTPEVDRQLMLDRSRLRSSREQRRSVSRRRIRQLSLVRQA